MMQEHSIIESLHDKNAQSDDEPPLLARSPGFSRCDAVSPEGGTAYKHASMQRCLSMLLISCLCAATSLHAQRATTSRQQTTSRTTTGGGRSFGGTGGAGTRQYYGPGEVGEAMVSSDPETRRLVVITDDETSQYISQVITNLDQPRAQVLIKVVFLEVTHRNTLDIGVEAAGQQDLGSVSQAGAEYFGLSGLATAATNQLLNQFGLPIQSFVPTPPGAGLYQIMGTDFQATLRLIASAGKSKILSRPSILTRNNQQATISLGQEVPLITSSTFNAINGQINNVNYTSVGIILRVTPFITADGKVEMIVSPETSILADRSQWVPIGQGALAPVINSRVADTVVVVPDGQTVIIGGLMENNKQESDSKIPILGDIPLLGLLFRRHVKDEGKTELIIFLTPRIVAEPGQLAAVSARERSQAVMTEKAFSEEELNRFLDGLPSQSTQPSNGKPSKKTNNN
jgi:general secretion pathway protein D